MALGVIDLYVPIESASGRGLYTSKEKAAYWDGKNEAGEPVASGVYSYTIQAGEFTATKKMIMAK